MSVTIYEVFEGDLWEVLALAYRAYREAGYIKHRADGLLDHYPHLDNIPETVTLAAELNGDMVGTCSYTMDGPRGLHTDADYPQETQRVRQLGGKLAASWRIATDPTCNRRLTVVQALMRRTAQDVCERAVDIALCTFHPRHERVYRRLWGFETIGRRAATKGLSNAPSVLMRLDRAALVQKLNKREQQHA
jgi:hypothetical protein